MKDYYRWTKIRNGESEPSETYTTTDQVNETIRYIEEKKDKPWFVWVGFNAPHTPFHNPPKDLHTYPKFATGAKSGRGDIVEGSQRGSYEASLQALDSEIGRLLAAVDLDKTTIILIGDNGTPGFVAQKPLSRKTAKGSLRQGGTHVPFIIAGPDVSEGAVSGELVHCVDLFETILGLCGVESAKVLPEKLEVDSLSLLPIVKGEELADRYILSEIFGSDKKEPGRAVVSSKYPEYRLVAYTSSKDQSQITSSELYTVCLLYTSPSPRDRG